MEFEKLIKDIVKKNTVKTQDALLELLKNDSHSEGATRLRESSFVVGKINPHSSFSPLGLAKCTSTLSSRLKDCVVMNPAVSRNDVVSATLYKKIHPYDEGRI